MVTYRKHVGTRFWAVLDAAGALICLCVYKKGAQEVARRLNSSNTAGGA